MRRYGPSSRGRAWNGASARRDADLFFADLMGVRPRARIRQPVYEDTSVYESAPPSYEDASVYESEAPSYEDDEDEGAPEIGDPYEDVHGPELAVELAPEAELEWETQACGDDEDVEDDEGVEVEDDEADSADGFAYDAQDEASHAEDDEDADSADAWEEP